MGDEWRFYDGDTSARLGHLCQKMDDQTGGLRFAAVRFAGQNHALVLVVVQQPLIGAVCQTVSEFIIENRMN